MRKRGASERLAFFFCGNTAAGTNADTPHNLRGVANDALRLCGGDEGTRKEHSDGIARMGGEK